MASHEAVVIGIAIVVTAGVAIGWPFVRVMFAIEKAVTGVVQEAMS